MNATDEPKRRTFSGTAKAVVLLAVIFMLGVIAGVGGTSLVMFKRLQANVRTSDLSAGPATRFMDRVGADVADELDLEPAEVQAVKEELGVSRERLLEIRKGLHGDMRELAGDTVERISRRLPEDKRQVLRDRVRERLRPWGLEPGS